MIIGKINNTTKNIRDVMIDNDSIKSKVIELILNIYKDAEITKHK